MRRALAFGLSGRDTVFVAAAGFMLRGGIVVLALPAVVLPSVIELAGTMGVDAFAIDGRPTGLLTILAIVTSVVAAAWLLVAVVLGSLFDVWLVEAAMDPEGPSMRKPRPLPNLELLFGLAGVRAVCLVPLAVAIAWGASQIYVSAYNELTTPSDLAVPLAVRTFTGAAAAMIVVAAVWLLQETLAAIAVRRLLFTGCGVPQAIAGAALQLIRRPISSAATMATAYMASAAVMLIGLGLTAAAFEWTRTAARMSEPLSVTIGVGPWGTTRDFRPVVFILATLTLVAAWIVSAGLAGIASAWRNAAFTGETVADTSRATAYQSEAPVGLSESKAATSGH
jgi:hypothetical protein